MIGLRSKPLRRRSPLRARSRRTKAAGLREHHGRVAQMPCIACGRWPVEVHHVVSDGMKRLRRDHRYVLPVCRRDHREGPEAIHVIGTAAWNALHEIDQLAAAVALWQQAEAAGARA